jgi:hypothetical protein
MREKRGDEVFLPAKRYYWVRASQSFDEVT